MLKLDPISPRPGWPSQPMARPARDWGTYKRILIRPEPGFYVMRLRSGAPLVPAIIYQICPMAIPEPTTITGPHPDEWCRPLDRSPRFAARVDGKQVDVERVWTARSLRRAATSSTSATDRCGAGPGRTQPRPR